MESDSRIRNAIPPVGWFETPVSAGGYTVTVIVSVVVD